MTEEYTVEPYDSEDEEWDDEGLEPSERNKLKIRKRKHKKAWQEQEIKRREDNRQSNSQVWKTYTDVHEPIIFHPETAKLVAEISKSKIKTLLYPNGSEYRGTVRGIKPEGEGIMQWAEGGGSYVGEFSNGAPHGQGRRIYANSDSYVGRWKNGRRHGFGTMTDKKDQRVLYEGLWRDGHKSNQASYAAGLPAPDRQEVYKARKQFNNLGSIANTTDAMVEKMLTAPEAPDPNSMPTYYGPRETNQKSKPKSKKKTNRKTEASKRKQNNETKDNETIDNNEESAASKVSAFYVKKEKLKKMKEAWHPYPHEFITPPLRRVAIAKVGVKIGKKYVKMMEQRNDENESMELSMKARKSIYFRERKALMKDYKRGLELLHEKFKKQRVVTLKMGVMRGGVAIPRSVREVKKLKDQYIQKNNKMMERRQRSIKAMKDEYLQDVQKLRKMNTNENIQQKTSYLQIAFARHRLFNEQEKKDEERAFSEDRRIEREKRQSARIKEALLNKGKHQKRTNADNDLEDNDGQKAKQLYQLSTLSRIIHPSLLQELNIAWIKWIHVTSFNRDTESLRINLVKITSKDTTKTDKPKVTKGSNVVVKTNVVVEL